MQGFACTSDLAPATPLYWLTWPCRPAIFCAKAFSSRLNLSCSTRIFCNSACCDGVACGRTRRIACCCLVKQLGCVGSVQVHASSCQTSLSSLISTRTFGRGLGTWTDHAWCCDTAFEARELYECELSGAVLVYRCTHITLRHIITYGIDMSLPL